MRYRAASFGGTIFFVAASFAAQAAAAAQLSGPAYADGGRCPGERFAVETVADGTSPYVRLSAGKMSGFFLLDYGTTQSSLSRDLFRDVESGTATAVEDISLPSFSTGRFALTNYMAAAQPQGGQLGIIGTDFLSLLTADFSFDNGRSDVVLSASPCDHEGLKARGMIGVRQSGFFSRDLSSIAASMPNVPVLFLDIGGVFAPAQMDTGYDDRAFPPSIDINDALYEKLVAAGITLNRIGNVSVSTCRGLSTTAVYAASQTKVSIVTDEHREIKQISGASFIRKNANGCGGIADMRRPAAQLGMSAIAALGSVVFDASSGLVWVRASR